jgi:SAM-dependent methyltransferase
MSEGLGVRSRTIWAMAGLRFVLIPGRHHVLTRFQARYLADLLAGSLRDLDGRPIEFTDSPVELVWAMTSANHQNTRRNPIPANRREAAIELFSRENGFRSLVVPIFDAPQTPRFGEITLKAVTAAAGGLVLAPDNCIVAVSTPSVIEMYRGLGFRIAGLELDHPEKPPRAWQVLEMLAVGDSAWRDHADGATIDVFERYALGDHVRMVLGDPIVGTEGSLTETRNYRTYAASFDAAAGRKWEQARPYVVPGRIVDVGCATGAMLELAGRDPALAEADLFGIEVAQHLYEECVHKKSQGVFANPNTFFFQRNILAGPVFPDASIDTTLTFALTHEIYSYAGGMEAIKALAGAIFRQTAAGGAWINSDVCGPEDGDRPVLLRFHQEGVRQAPVDLEAMPAPKVTQYLEGLSPAARLAQFAADFPRLSGGRFEMEAVDDRTARLSLNHAMEFTAKFSYTDNWLSECHERFCALDWAGWKAIVESAGFEIDPRSGPFRNDWLPANRFDRAALLTDLDGNRVPWPVTHLLLVARRPHPA